MRNSKIREYNIGVESLVYYERILPLCTQEPKMSLSFLLTSLCPIPAIAVFLDGTKKNCLSPRQLALCKTAKVNKPIYILYL